MKKVGAVIIFREGVTLAEANALIKAMKVNRPLPSRGSADQPAIDHATVKVFNPDHGEPVFYIP